MPFHLLTCTPILAHDKTRRCRALHRAPALLRRLAKIRLDQRISRLPARGLFQGERALRLHRATILMTRHLRHLLLAVVALALAAALAFLYEKTQAVDLRERNE